jgi:hypothetical protein
VRRRVLQISQRLIRPSVNVCFQGTVGLGPIGARLIQAGLFLCQPTSPKPLASLSFIGSLANEKSTGLQDHTVLPYAASSAKNSNQPSAGQPKIWRGRLSAVRLRAMLAHGSPPCEHIHTPDAAASTATRPNVRDDGQRPSSRDGMARVVRVIWGGGEAEYFCVRGWTGQITLKLL